MDPKVDCEEVEVSTNVEDTTDKPESRRALDDEPTIDNVNTQTKDSVESINKKVVEEEDNQNDSSTAPKPIHTKEADGLSLNSYEEGELGQEEVSLFNN